jgi:hypothetical protein
MRCIIILIAIFGSLAAKSQVELRLDSSKVSNGNGVLHFRTTTGESLGNVQIREGHMNGSYRSVDTSRLFELNGVVRYDPACYRNWPAFDVVYVSGNGDTIETVLDSATLNRYYKIHSLRFLKISPSKTMIKVAEINPELNFNFGDPYVFPVGSWKFQDTKRNYIYKEVVYDNCGILKEIKLFRPDGKLLRRVLPGRL